MKDEFQEFYNLLKLDREKSPWSKNNTLRSRFEELESEIEEIKLAIEHNDFDNLREELGDALWDLLFLIIIAEEKNLFSGKHVIEGSIAKLKRRKPWIFSGEVLDEKEEVKRWFDNKLLEKNGK